MPKKVLLENHLSPEELWTRYRNASNSIARSHYQILWLLATGKNTLQVAEVTGYSRAWVYQIMGRYNQQGIDGLGDKRRHNQGQEPLLDDVQQAQLHQVLLTPAPDDGLWNGRKVADWMSQITGKKVSRHRGWEDLRQMEYVLRVPRPEHQESSRLEQSEWKKNSI